MPLGLLLAATVTPAAARLQEPEAPPAEPCGPVLPQLELEDLHAAPREHLGGLARVRFQLRGERVDWIPYLTRFGPEDYAAFDAWSDGQVLWEKEQFDAPIATLYVRRDSEVARTLRAASSYARFEASVRVEQLFLGRPWIELFEVVPLTEAVNDGALLHATRAVRAMALGQLDRAEGDFLRALASNLPALARGDLERRIDAIELLRTGASGTPPVAPPRRPSTGRAETLRRLRVHR